MGLLIDLLTFPVLGPVRGAKWIAEKIAGQVERELYDEDGVRKELMELELRHDLGEISDEEFEATERELLERLKVIRQAEGRQ